MPSAAAIPYESPEAAAAAPRLDLYERLGRFTDLIYCPLDLPTPPAVPRSDLLDWVARARGASKTREERLSDHAASAAYPWNSAYAARSGRWLEEFDTRFPQLVAYLGLFPTADWSCVNVLVQEPQAEVWLHTDPDPVLGWRVYLGHGGARVYFHPMRERRRERLATWTAQGRRDWSRFVDTSRRLYATVPADSCAWTLNACRAAHGVEAHGGAAGERTTLLLVPEVGAIDLDRYLALLERSVAKYSEHAIWYPGTPS
jgi:hypothetical protein